ncbi:MAG: KdsC family phosphatase [Massiliimalia sp.]|jgi:3-deoxy-D-manno-octulosonate 8-phosphate phosphatase (KDO 8-P phosphatase)
MKQQTQIKVLVLDVDGTLTDGKIYMGQSGELMKAFHVKDGYGICKILPEIPVDWTGCPKTIKPIPRGIVPVILTARNSQILEHRCQELGIIHVYQGCGEKAAMVEKIANDFGLTVRDETGRYCEISYMGDDLVDLEAIRMCRFTACPADAAESVREAVEYICGKTGGDGAVREWIEWLAAYHQSHLSELES